MNREKLVKTILACPLWLILIAAFLGGMLYAAALPPLNWNFAVFICLVPLMFIAIVKNWKIRLLTGWVWGLGWSFFAYNFLREIHPAVPWMLAPIISLWPAVYTLLLGFAAQKILSNRDFDNKCQLDIPVKEALLFLFSAAALFTVMEWTRYYLFVWNDLSVTMWRLPALMQIARLTGRYGVSFLITSVNAALFAFIFLRQKRWLSGAVMLIFPLVAVVYGVYRMNCDDGFKNRATWKCALIQGNLPQQRIANPQIVIHAINTYYELSRTILPEEPRTVIWPECAIPIALRSASDGGDYYRRAVAALNTQMIIGTLDYGKNPGEITNSALLISADGKYNGKYDKFHRVPYGEYVPFRKYLPESWVKAFDMGRDLTDGKKLEPLVVSDNIRPGTAVCYEGVFSYVSAGFARNGANVLAAISNDVWYPESSEPEQHLANAVMRCVETGLPMVRCGNNGGSGVVTNRGVFTQYIGSESERPELLREKAAGVVTVEFEADPELTMAVRFENWFVHLLIILLITIFCRGICKAKEKASAQNN